MPNPRPIGDVRAVERSGIVDRQREEIAGAEEYLAALRVDGARVQNPRTVIRDAALEIKHHDDLAAVGIDRRDHHPAP